MCHICVCFCLTFLQPATDPRRNPKLCRNGSKTLVRSRSLRVTLRDPARRNLGSIVVEEEPPVLIKAPRARAPSGRDRLQKGADTNDLLMQWWVVWLFFWGDRFGEGHGYIVYLWYIFIELYRQMRWDVVVAVSPHTALQKHVKNPAQVFGQSLPLWMWPDRNLVILQPCIYMWVQSHKQTYYYIYQ